MEREDKWVGGREWGAQGKAGAGEPRDAGLDSTEGGRCGRLPAQALIEDELGHRCRGVSPVGHGLGRLVPQRGGPRARASAGGVVGSPRWVRMDGRADAWVMKAMMRIWPPHSVQRRGKIS